MRKCLLLVLSCLFLITFFGCSSKVDEAYYCLAEDYNKFSYNDSPFIKKVVIKDDSVSYRINSKYFVVSEDIISIIKEEEEVNIDGQHWTVYKGPDGSKLFYSAMEDDALILHDMRGNSYQSSLSGYYKIGKEKDSLGHTASSIIKVVESHLQKNDLKKLDSKAYKFCDKSEYEIAYIEKDDYWYIEGYIIVDESKLYDKSSWESPYGKFNDEFRILLRYSNKKDYEVLYFDMN